RPDAEGRPRRHHGRRRLRYLARRTRGRRHRPRPPPGGPGRGPHPRRPGQEGRPGQAGRRAVRPTLRPARAVRDGPRGHEHRHRAGRLRHPVGAVDGRPRARRRGRVLGVGRPAAGAARGGAGVPRMSDVPPPLVAAVALCLFVGSTLVLGELPWFRRRPLVDRLAPYVPGGAAVPRRSALMSAASFGQVIAPLARAVGERLARLCGVTEPVAVRLERIHSPLDATAFRVRQLAWMVVGLVGGGVLAVGAGLGGPLALAFVAGGPVLAFLLVEQRLATASARWQRRIELELPVVAEQLGMLLGAGYSLGSALGRLATRGAGACGRDLGRVTGRIRQGLTEVEALREWAEVADVDALRRLVA